MQSIKRGFFWNTIGSTAYFAAQWLVTFLVLRLGGIEASGLLSTAMTVTNAFIALSGFGMRYYQVSDVKGDFTRKAYILSRFITCGISAVLCILFSFAISYSAQQRICIALWLLYRMSEPLSDVYNGICQKCERLDIVGKSYLARALLTIVPFAALLMLTKSIYITLFVMAVLMWLIVLCYDIPKALACPAEHSGQGSVAALLLCCAPLALYKLFETAAASVPKLFLERVLGTDALAVYNPATSPVLLLQTGASFLLVPLVTVFANALAAKDKAAFKKLLLRVAALLLALLPFGVLICVSVGEWGLSVISPELSAYSSLLIPMVFAATLTSLVMFLSMLLTVLRALKSLIFANLAALAASAALSVPCISAFGMNGATYALCIALAAEGVIMCIILYKQYKKRFNY